MKISSAEFVVSNSDVRNCPDTKAHEFAFIGRSNVGKSSLINMLTGRKGLAMTSSTPGKTMLINHFLINDTFYIVDLPGYGYAQRGKENREKLRAMIEDYILNRRQMTSLFVLIDSRHEPQKIDLEFFDWLGENGVPFAIVFTKGDKQGSEKLKNNVKSYCNILLETWEELPPVFVTSSSNGLGRDELLDYMDELNSLPLNCE